MSEILGCVVNRNDMMRMTTAQIFDKYASPAQQASAEEFNKRFWDITLCKEDIGFDFLHFDEPIQDAAEVLEAWNEEYHIVYLTGRIEPTRKSTLSQLETHGFPIEGTQLVMFQIEDYNQTCWALGLESVGPTLIKIRSKYFSLIVQQNPVMKIVDDFHGYFTVYRKHDIPDRIGLISSPLYKEQTFLDHGATRVIRCWSELLDS
jgi:hypothetical protein